MLSVDNHSFSWIEMHSLETDVVGGFSTRLNTYHYETQNHYRKEPNADVLSNKMNISEFEKLGYSQNRTLKKAFDFFGSNNTGNFTSD